MGTTEKCTYFILTKIHRKLLLIFSTTANVFGGDWTDNSECHSQNFPKIVKRRSYDFELKIGKKFGLLILCFFLNFRSESSAQQSLTAQIKHLDMMCVTLERQIDVLGNVDHALPVTGKYSNMPFKKP